MKKQNFELYEGIGSLSLSIKLENLPTKELMKVIKNKINNAKANMEINSEDAGKAIDKLANLGKLLQLLEIE